jgi:hypothetical protein
MFLQFNVVRANEVLFQVTPDEFERTMERAMNLHGKQIPSIKQVCKIETSTPVCMKFFAGGVYLHSEYLENWQGITALTLRQESREGEHAITGAVTWAILLSKTFQFANPDLSSVELANLLKTVFASQAIWLLPSPAFRQFAFEARGGLWDIPNKTGSPKKALSNLLERDAMFTEQLRQETNQLKLESIDVDGQKGIDIVTNLVAEHFKLRS